MGRILSPSDLEAFMPGVDAALAEIVIEDVEAQAAEICDELLDVEFPHAGSVKSILRQIALRWLRSQSGPEVSSSTQSAGPFSQTVSFRDTSSGRFFPNETERLRALCRKASGEQRRRHAYTVQPGIGVIGRRGYP